jgi:putative DNA primase/helicase
MFAGRADYGVGIATGPESDLLVFDVDPRNGGLETLKAIFTEEHPFPRTPVVATGGDGCHLYFRFPNSVEKFPSEIGPGVELKATGGGVVAPPSLHASGERYAWQEWENKQPARVPEFLLSAIGTAAKKKPRSRRGASVSGTSNLCATGTTADRDEDATDVVNARLFAREHGDAVRYVHDRKRWLWWTGKRWAVDENGAVTRLAMETVDRLFARAIDASRAERPTLLKRAKSAESATKIRAMLELAQSIEPIAINSRLLDVDPNLLNVDNGTIDLKTFEIRPHDCADLITRIVPASYDPDAPATCPTFEGFINRIMGENPRLVAFIQRVVGYCLTGDTSEQVLFIFWGIGANGKSTLILIVEDMLAGYAIRCRVETLLLKREAGSATPDVARLAGARFIGAVEAQDGRRLDEAMVKELTGGDTITARFLYGQPFEFRPVGKIVLVTNHRPTVYGTDEAIWRRIRLVPFAVFIPPEDRDPHLIDKLRGEMDGILAWAIRGCEEWRRVGLDPPPEVTEATATYRLSEDRLAEFIEDECVLDPPVERKHADLFHRYKDWADRNGEVQMSPKAFSKALDDRRIEKKTLKNRNSTRVRVGIGLKPEGDRW